MDWVVIIAVIFWGWISGMFVNYIADVLPIRRRLVRPFCQNCEKSYYLVSYFFWPRRCNYCDTRRKNRVWLVEIAMIGINLWFYFSETLRASYLIWSILLIFFCLVIVIDVEWRLILHPINAFGVILGIGIGFWLHGWKKTILGGLAGFLIMLGLYLLGILLARVYNRMRGKSIDAEPLGFGDVLLGGVTGLLLGWPGILAGVYLTIILAGVFSLLYIILLMFLKRYQVGQAIPYGPFIILSTAYLLFI